MVDADSRLIEWLLDVNKSGVTRYKISKDIGVSESTLSRIANGHTPMDAVRFGLAHKLTDYARSIQSSTSTQHTEDHDEQDDATPKPPTSKGGDET